MSMMLRLSIASLLDFWAFQAVSIGRSTLQKMFYPFAGPKIPDWKARLIAGVKLSTSTYPLGTRPHRFGPLRSYLEVIFMRFRGPKALNDKLPVTLSTSQWRSLIIRIFLQRLTRFASVR
jgi:hypothetical protein